MYIIFDKINGYLQLSFNLIDEINFENGILRGNNFSDLYLNNNFYESSQKIIIFSNCFTFINTKYIFKDFRIQIKNRVIQLVFKNLFFSMKYLILFRNIIFKTFMYFLFLLIIYKFFSLYFYNSKNILLNEETLNEINLPTWNIKDFSNYFKETKLAKKYSEEKMEYLNSEIPNLNGFENFRIIPLNYLNHIDSGNFLLSLSYKEITLITNNNSAFKEYPFKSCKEDSVFFYLLKNDADLIIINNKNLIGNNNNFVIINLDKNISEDKIIQNQCFEFQNKKIELEN